MSEGLGARLVLGVALIALARFLWVATHSKLLATVCLLPGLSFVLHFGLFNLCAGFWRACGFATYTLFSAPLRSVTLREFWGRRWNLPFTEMVQVSAYRPLLPLLGRQGAAVGGFVMSGLLHEMAIRLPVHVGYGWPMLYFVLHGVFIVLERTALRDWKGFGERP